MKTNFKFLGLGLLGGMLPLGLFLCFNSPYKSLSDEVIDGNRMYNARFASNVANPMMTENFVDASESTINSVVHVTTKVVKTTVQQDPFFEFFYGPGSGNRELKQYGSGSGSGVIVSSEGYIVTNNHVIDNASEIEVILNKNPRAGDEAEQTHRNHGPRRLDSPDGTYPGENG